MNILLNELVDPKLLQLTMWHVLILSRGDYRNAVRVHVYADSFTVLAFRVSAAQVA